MVFVQLQALLGIPTVLFLTLLLWQSTWAAVGCTRNQCLSFYDMVDYRNIRDWSDKAMYGGFDYGIIFVIIFTAAATARLIYYHTLDLTTHAPGLYTVLNNLPEQDLPEACLASQ